MTTSLSDLKRMLHSFDRAFCLCSTRTGNEVANQVVVVFENGEVFYSYKSLIAIVIGGKVYLTEKWNYSRTTSKYLNEFLRQDRKTVHERIASGEYQILTEEK